MVDRRKALHRRACDWSAGHPEVFLTGQIPYASVVEQMTVRRMPLPAFAARDSATSAFARIWTEIQARLQQRGEGSPRPRDRWARLLRAIESLIVRLESAGGDDAGSVPQALDVNAGGGCSPQGIPDVNGSQDVHIVHSFDTGDRDLQRRGYVVQLSECAGRMRVTAARSECDDDATDATKRVQAQIDNWWAAEILSGVMSPLTALERRLSTPKSGLVERVIAIVAGRRLFRIGSRVAGQADTESGRLTYALNS